MSDRDIILAINDVELGLVAAVKKHSRRLGRELKGLVLIDSNYADNERARDLTGFFKEVRCDFDNPKALQQALKPYTDRILAVTCRKERSIQSFRKAIPFLPYVNTPSESALLWSTEKQKMRDRLQDFDSRLTPQYRYLSEYKADELGVIMQGMTYPVIVKPNGLASSVLVTRCEDQDELAECLEQTFEIINDIYSRDFGRGEPSLLIEEMIVGNMYSTDAYISPTGEIYFLPIVRVFTAHDLGLDGFYGLLIKTPIDISDKQITSAQAAATGAIKALNLSSSTAHIELFHTPDGQWKIIEVGPRIGGYREALYRESYGIDHYYNDLAVRMGLEPEIPTTPLKYAAGLNLYAEEEGHIKSIKGLEAARRLASTVYLDVHAKPGDLALFAGNGGQLIVDGILSNKDTTELESHIKQVREQIVISVEPAKELALVY